MPISFDAATAAAYQTATFSHTVGVRQNRVLFVHVGVDTNLSPDVSGVTYAGVAMTEIGSALFSYNSYVHRTYYLFAPTSGANNVIVSGPTNTFTCIAWSYGGALQSGMPDAANTANGAVSPYTKSLTTVAPNAWQMFITRNDTGAASASTGSTLRANGNTIFVDVFDSNAGLTPGSNSMTVTRGGGVSFVSAMISFAPAAESSMLALL